ncbi:MAG: SUMF1/EgtB/PvdO family nonheme iron enzyme [Hyphomicrobium sp.]
MKIFINYRRNDVKSDAARIRDRLASMFGEASVFMDVENLQAGQRFDLALNKQLAECDILLAVMGPRWLELFHERQASGEGDFVREEIATALKREIPVFPVMVDHTPMPRKDDLPEDMRKLVLHHKHDVSHEQFSRDMDGLAAAIRKTLNAPLSGSGSTGRVGQIAAGLVSLFLAGGAIAHYAGLTPPWATPAGVTTASTLGPAAKPASQPTEPVREAMLRSDDQPSNLKDAEATRAGRVFRDCPDLCPEMVVIAPGEFAMGADDGDVDEGPVHKVTLARPFAAGRTEITFDEWDACVADGSCQHKPEADWGRGRQPVMRVSWDDVTKQFLPWLSRKAGAPYRLLTEAEWEYVARAGSSAPYATGDAINRRQAQFSDRRTVDVGSFPVGKWGAFDMAGNVWEWVQDCHSDSYSGVPADGKAAPDAFDCVRVMRGGSWLSKPDELRAANREWDRAGSRVNTIGFRVARSF